MRIGLRDILGLADPEQYLTELSNLAEACLQYALEVVVRKHKIKAPAFVVIGLGKLGGAEIDYGSDLDVLFVADSRTKDLSALAPLAFEILDLLSARTEQGVVFRTDARLRPDGEKGLLVNTLGAYEEYYRQRAQLWEIQSLTRTRPVAGDTELGARFQALAAALTNFGRPSLPLAAYSADWKNRIHEMRLRIEKERTPSGKDDLAIKTSGTVPADTWLPAPVAPTVLANLTGFTVTTLSGSTVTVSTGITPPSGGGFEIRLRDFAFMPGEDPALVMRGSQQSLTFSRVSASDRFYIRMYDGSTPPNYSEFSTALFINLPLSA